MFRKSPSKDCFGPTGTHFIYQKCSRLVLVSKWPNWLRLVGLITEKSVIRKTYTDKINIRSCKRKKWKLLPLTEQQNIMVSLRNRKYWTNRKPLLLAEAFMAAPEKSRTSNCQLQTCLVWATHYMKLTTFLSITKCSFWLLCWEMWSVASPRPLCTGTTGESCFSGMDSTSSCSVDKVKSICYNIIKRRATLWLNCHKLLFAIEQFYLAGHLHSVMSSQREQELRKI